MLKEEDVVELKTLKDYVLMKGSFIVECQEEFCQDAWGMKRPRENGRKYTTKFVKSMTGSAYTEGCKEQVSIGQAWARCRLDPNSV